MFLDIEKEEETEVRTWLLRFSVNDKWLKYFLFIVPRAILWEHRENHELTKLKATRYDRMK